MVELRVLRTILEHDPGGRWHCVRLLDWFDYRGHVVMVFERLGPSLYDYLRKNDYAAFPLDLVRDTARQLLEALAFLHSLGLVHTDLKPENVLQRGVEVVRASWPSGSRLARRLPATHALCLVDFGSAAWDADAHAHVVSTRHYRAPEVVLGAGWSWPADLWSLGCMVVEMLTGDALFATHENAEHLAMMQAALGTLPRRLVEAGRAPDVARLFKRCGCRLLVHEREGGGFKGCPLGFQGWTKGCMSLTEWWFRVLAGRLVLEGTEGALRGRAWAPWGAICILSPRHGDS